MRPRFHFTPSDGWLNDPNGLVYFDGEYHLFYQHNPNDIIWGPMHWGHAVSRDLLRWQHLPIALYPDEIGMIYSGSAVVDWHDTAGFGAQTLVAIFTHHQPGREAQHLAFSLDHGRTWRKYEGNPVLTPPPAVKDFRDPRVFWHVDH
ncbi:MAG: glycoside hydrolase family 32 protein [Chloroflexi bacterium]|nr:glycoside hydrolase family 32 protein [Chloroflexota bacterium]